MWGIPRHRVTPEFIVALGRQRARRESCHKTNVDVNGGQETMVDLTLPSYGRGHWFDRQYRPPLNSSTYDRMAYVRDIRMELDMQ